jgi:uncharacterized protein with von Willebrand factor type A (vWA) domain
VLIRYSRWDGSQDLPDLDADDLLGAMADDILGHGDPWPALRRLLQQGAAMPEGRRLPGFRDLLERLRRSRQERLDRYDLGSSLADIERRLDQVIATERAGLARLPEGPARSRRERALDALPPDAASRIRRLQDYDFADPEARRQFQALLDSLRRQVLQPFLEGMHRALASLGSDDLRRLADMLQDLERLLRERAQGREPNFEAFRGKWGDHFPGVDSLDQLLERIARQAAAMQSLFRSLTPEQRRRLDAALRALFLREERLEAAMAQLAVRLGELLDLDEATRRYPFHGQEEVTLGEALRLMDELGQLDRLEGELRSVRRLEDLERLDPGAVERLLGEDARRDVERLRGVSRTLEAAGYLERRGDELALTPRAARRIADRALREVFARLGRAGLGGHPVHRRGAGGDQTDDTKPYEFGDPFLLDLKETVLGAVRRRGPGTPVSLAAEDFAVHRTELAARAATVVMLDMSRSMLNNGYVVPAKKVALALAALIRGQFPRDALYIVGFSLYARRFQPDELPALDWSEWNIGTNMQAGFLLARRLLARHPGGTRQILVVTDGEPTAHLEGEVADFSYPPTRRTLEETLKEARRCTREGITINTFMLERSPWLTAFVERMARINRGRAFFTSPDRLGEYVVVDYVTSRRWKL